MEDARPRPVARRLLVPLAAVGVLVLLGAAAFVARRGEISDDAAPGFERELAPSEVERLEQRLVAAPNDLEARGRLLVHYFTQDSPANRQAHARHALWVVANAPASDLAAMTEGVVEQYRAPEEFP